MKNVDISSKDNLKPFLQQHARKRGIPLRTIGEALGFKPPYFSDLINGKKKRNVEFLNALADYLEVPRVEVYQAAGWLDLDEDDLLMNRVKEWSAKDPNFRQAIERMMEMDVNQRSRMFVWIFFKTLQETNRLQISPLNFNWDEAIKTGDISPNALHQLNPDQRQALTGVIQLMLEAFLAKDAKGEGDQILGNAETPKSE